MSEICSSIYLVSFSVGIQTQRFIRVYNLTKQELTKKLVSNVKWISSMAVHPKGKSRLPELFLANVIRIDQLDDAFRNCF